MTCLLIDSPSNIMNTHTLEQQIQHGHTFAHWSLALCKTIWHYDKSDTKKDEATQHDTYHEAFSQRKNIDLHWQETHDSTCYMCVLHHWATEVYSPCIFYSEYIITLSMQNFTVLNLTWVTAQNQEMLQTSKYLYTCGRLRDPRVACSHSPLGQRACKWGWYWVAGKLYATVWMTCWTTRSNSWKWAPSGELH